MASILVNHIQFARQESPSMPTDADSSNGVEELLQSGSSEGTTHSLDPKSIGALVGVLVVVVIFFAVAVWFLFGYRDKSPKKQPISKEDIVRVKESDSREPTPTSFTTDQSRDMHQITPVPSAREWV